MTDILTFEENLRTKGIDFMGYGMLPKYAMIDRDLSLGAKALYAYFCSYAGVGGFAFPSRDKILSDLQIGKKAYYNYLNLLTGQGYIAIKPQLNNTHYSNNKYIIVANPKKFADLPEDTPKRDLYMKIKVSGLKSIGYGNIPKAIMMDNRLSLKAKGIYAYFCSFAGAGNIVFPKRDTILYHLDLVTNTYYKHFNMLIRLNYLTSVQRREHGGFGLNEYTMEDFPDVSKVVISEKPLDLPTISPCLKKVDMENDPNEACLKKADMENEPNDACLKKADMEMGPIKKAYLRKADTNINNTNNNNFINNNSNNTTTNSLSITRAHEGAQNKEETFTPISVQELINDLRSEDTRNKDDSIVIPSLREVREYFMSDIYCMDLREATIETSKFFEYNEARDWDCLPHWKVAALRWANQKIRRENRHW